MKAMTLVGKKVPLELQQREDLTPGAGQVIVRLNTAALNRRDYWITVGLYPGIKPPVVLGSDGAGVVSACGDGVDGGWQGQEVILNPGIGWGDDPAVQGEQFRILGLPEDGTFASEVAVPVKQLQRKPECLTWEESAAIPLAGTTAYRALFTQGNAKSGERILITGVGGGVATFALQFATAINAEVWVTSSSKAKIDRAVSLGARGGFDYREEGWEKSFAAKVGAPDLIIDSAGGPGYGALMGLAAPGGRIINYGATAGAPESIDMFKLFWKQLRLQGSTMGSPDDFSSMVDLVEKYQIKPVIHAVHSLEDTNQAIDQMRSSPQFGKYVIKIA
ncbi:zinc-binding dehydrogenase [bacterium]|nr:zinc-binding dehydrogenase [bacterium]MDB4446006.1 zinc-binding dehydrogenase [bacterium]MDB4506152.1 zinc-binding dehydrogenase [bacterium]